MHKNEPNEMRMNGQSVKLFQQIQKIMKTYCKNGRFHVK